jgi:hypothetical protein
LTAANGGISLGRAIPPKATDPPEFPDTTDVPSLIAVTSGFGGEHPFSDN